MFCEHLAFLHLEEVVLSITLINALIFLVFSVYKRKKNPPQPLAFPLDQILKHTSGCSQI